MCCPVLGDEYVINILIIYVIGMKEREKYDVGKGRPGGYSLMEVF